MIELDERTSVPYKTDCLITKDIVLIEEYTTTQSYYNNEPISVNDKNQFLFSQLIQNLKCKNNELDQAIIYLYDQEQEQFVLQGADPFMKPKYINYTPYEKVEMLYIRYKNGNLFRSKPVKQECQVPLHYFSNQTSSLNASIVEEGKLYENSISQSQLLFVKSEQESYTIDNNNNNIAEQTNNLENHSYCILQQQTIDNSNFQQQKQQQQQLLYPLHQQEQEEEIEDQTHGNKDQALQSREKRVKERQIKYVRDKVLRWRKFYEQGVQEKGMLRKVNLDMAAQLVGLSRKTLDDYYAQLRKAEQYHFNFDQHSNDKMGVLRKYVKEMQEKGVPIGQSNGEGQIQQIQQQQQQQNYQSVKPQENPDSNIKNEAKMEIEVQGVEGDNLSQYKQMQQQNNYYTTLNYIPNNYDIIDQYFNFNQTVYQPKSDPQSPQ